VLAFAPVRGYPRRRKSNYTHDPKKLNLLLLSPRDYIFIRRILISGIVLAWKLD
jgi:hypothetical protein